MSNQSVPTSKPARKSSARSTMDRKLKAKWLRALRSGKFLQGKDWLKYKDSAGKTRYCCLGVLCEVGRIRSSNEAMIRNREGEVRILDFDAQELLSSWNDRGVSFKKISKWIEQNL